MIALLDSVSVREADRGPADNKEQSGAGPGGSSSNSNENFVKNELPVHGLPSSRATIAGNPVPGMTHLHGGASQQPVHHTSA